ncbi:hypothetical protein BDR26DRAFT_955780 [Obelidium mucronatum]|nr:hypothetical protein BDR26DRAFT_955780 [Obelidium mucronatum]
MSGKTMSAAALSKLRDLRMGATGLPKRDSYCKEEGCGTKVFAAFGFCPGHKKECINRCAARAVELVEGAPLCRECFVMVAESEHKPNLFEKKQTKSERPLPRRDDAAGNPSRGTGKYKYSFVVHPCKAVLSKKGYSYTPVGLPFPLEYECSYETEILDLHRRVFDSAQLLEALAKVKKDHGPNFECKYILMSSTSKGSPKPHCVIEPNQTLKSHSAEFKEWTKTPKRLEITKPVNNIHGVFLMEALESIPSNCGSSNSNSGLSVSKSISTVFTSGAVKRSRGRPRKDAQPLNSHMSEVTLLAPSDSNPEEPSSKRGRQDVEALWDFEGTAVAMAIGNILAPSFVGTKVTTSTLNGVVYQLVLQGTKYEKTVLHEGAVIVQLQELGRGSFRRVMPVLGGTWEKTDNLPSPKALVFKHFLGSRDRIPGDRNANKAIDFNLSQQPSTAAASGIIQQHFVAAFLKKWCSESCVAQTLKENGVLLECIPAFGFDIDKSQAQEFDLISSGFLEPRLYDQDFVKFFHNSGVCEEDMFPLGSDKELIFNLLSSFSHFTFQKYQGQILITDLQGGVTGRHLRLTDVAVVMSVQYKDKVPNL